MPEITKISHGLTIGDLKFGNARPGVVEATLKPGETMEQALDELDDRLNAWHRKKYPHLYEVVSAVSVMNPSYVPPPSTLTTTGGYGPPLEINRQHERMKDEIDDMQSIEGLRSWKEANPVIPYPILTHYNNRLVTLTSPT